MIFAYLFVLNKRHHTKISRSLMRLDLQPKIQFALFARFLRVRVSISVDTIYNCNLQKKPTHSTQTSSFSEKFTKQAHQPDAFSALVWPLEVYVGRCNSLVRVDLVRFARSIIHLIKGVCDDLHQTAIGMPGQLSFLAQSHPHNVLVGRVHAIAGHAVGKEKHRFGKRYLF